jgi:hypothetical protein
MFRSTLIKTGITAAFLATTLASETQGLPEARDAKAAPLANTRHAMATSNVDFGRATVDHDFETVRPSPFGTKSVLLAQATTGDTEDLRKALEQERHRAELLERLLTLRRAPAESAGINHASESENADFAKSLQQVHDRLKQASETGAAAPCKSLRGDRADGRLEQALAAARREVETQTALAAKANEDATQSKQAAVRDTAEFQKSLQQERERAQQLEQALAVARRDIETQTALAAKANDDATQLKQTPEDRAAELKESLQQERERARQLEQALAAARRDAEMQATRAAKANEDATQLKQAAENGAVELKKFLRRTGNAQNSWSRRKAQQLTVSGGFAP